MKTHIQRHDGVKPHACKFPGCDYKCVTSSQLKRHFLRNHTNRRNKSTVKGNGKAQKGAGRQRKQTCAKADGRRIRISTNGKEGLAKDVDPQISNASSVSSYPSSVYALHLEANGNKFANPTTFVSPLYPSPVLENFSDDFSPNSPKVATRRPLVSAYI